MFILESLFCGDFVGFSRCMGVHANMRDDFQTCVAKLMLRHSGSSALQPHTMQQEISMQLALWPAVGCKNGCVANERYGTVPGVPAMARDSILYNHPFQPMTKISVGLEVNNSPRHRTQLANNLNNVWAHDPF